MAQPPETVERAWWDYEGASRYYVTYKPSECFVLIIGKSLHDLFDQVVPPLLLVAPLQPYYLPLILILPLYDDVLGTPIWLQVRFPIN